jgi:hypothetical protein
MLLADLEKSSARALERAKIRERMWQELEAAKEAVRILGTHDPV